MNRIKLTAELGFQTISQRELDNSPFDRTHTTAEASHRDAVLLNESVWCSRQTVVRPGGSRNGIGSIFAGRFCRAQGNRHFHASAKFQTCEEWSAIRGHIEEELLT